MIETIEVLCLNCGRTFKCKTNRFPVCECGHTVAHIGSKPYGRYNKDSVTIVNEGYEVKFPLSDHNILISELIDLDFEDEDNVKKKILSQNKHLPLMFTDYKVSDILLHMIHYKHSNVYKAVFDSQHFALAKALSHEEYFRKFNAQMPNKTMNDLDDYLFDFPEGDKRTCIALDCCLYGLSPYEAKILSENNISVENLDEMIDYTALSRDMLIRYIDECGMVLMTASEIQQTIEDYYFYSSELRKWTGQSIEVHSPLYIELPIIKAAYFMNQRNGLIPFKKYYDKFNGRYPPKEINGYIIKQISGKELENLPFNTLPQQDLTAPIIVACKSDNNESDKGFDLNNVTAMLLNVDDKIFIHGNVDDRLKTAFNKYLDILEEKG